MSATIPAATLQKFSSFGDFLRFLRRRAGLTQTELSLAVGYGPAQISRLEQNLRLPDLTILEARFVDALDLQGDPKAVARLMELARESRPSSPAPDAAPHNLPQSLTSFIGREQEIADVKRLLATRRLVTLTGSGGTGKTRLALRVASGLLDHFSDGVSLVELAPLHDGALIPQTVMHIFGLITERGRPPLETLTAHLSDKSLLIILDNCEHLLAESGSFVEAVLQAAPSVKVLATSREMLNLAGEQAYRVPSLKVPDINHLPDAQQLAQYEAVQLFLERVALVSPGFTITQSNAALLAQTCRRLDGIPLAIELAAARVKSMPLETLVSRLDDRFHLLTGGSRNALPRQQTLRATIDWSYALLSEPEKLLLQRLSVFRGGWTLEAAEAVCSDERIEEPEVLDLLSKLVDKSLVALDEGSRYGMLETVRQYMGEKLIDCGHPEWARDQHLRYMLELAEQAEPEIRGPNQLTWLDRLDAELDNLRLAIAWAEERDVELFLRLTSAIWRFWLIRIDSSEGLEWLECAVGRTQTLHTVDRARALARLAFERAEFRYMEAARQAAHEAVELSTRLGNKPCLAMALSELGWCERSTDPSRSASLCNQALVLSREMGDHWLAANALRPLAYIAMHRHDQASARTISDQVLRESRLSGDKRFVTHDLTALAHLDLAQGSVSEAQSLLEESRSIADEIGDQARRVQSRVYLALAALFREEYQQAEALLEHAYELAKVLNDPVNMAFVLHNFGLVDWARGNGTRMCEREQAAVVIGEQEGYTYALCVALYLLAVSYGLAEEYEVAMATARRALELARVTHDEEVYSYCYYVFGHLALVRGQPERAVRLFAARQRLRDHVFADDFYPFMVRERMKAIAEARAQLGEEAFDTAWAEGQAMSEDEMLAYALE